MATLLVILGFVLPDGSVDLTWWLIWVSVLFLVAIGLLDPWLAQSRSTALSSDQQLDAAAAGLATAIMTQLRDEQVIRELDLPCLLPLRWTKTQLPIFDQSLAQKAADEELSGSLGDAASWFRQLPKQRLVVLGPAGSGKSSLALVLALGLLEDLGPKDMIPVLLPLSSWNTKENLRSWIARRLREDYPALRNTELYGGFVADLLVEQRRILPIFDSFDEISPTLWQAAITGIDHALPPGASFVLMSRPEAYSAAVLEAGVLRATPVVDLLPVDHEDMASVLRTSASSIAAARWEPVLLHMQHDSHGPIARTLVNPLMFWLARTKYADLKTNPTELLDSLRFPDEAAIQNYLLDGLLPTLFPPIVADYLPVTSDRWEPTFAKHWLTFLACRVRHRELPWWELRHLVHRYWLTILGAVALGLLTALGVAMMVILSTRLAAVGTAMIAGASAGCLVIVGALITASAKFRGSAFTLRIGAARSLFVMSVLAATATGLILGPLFGLEVGLVSAFFIAVATTLRFSIGSPGELGRMPSPQLTLARDRALVGLTCLVFGVGASALTALFFGAGKTGFIWLGFFSGALLGFVLSVLSRSWWWFSIAKTWLAMRGFVPWRLMEFLEDAHRLGILRRVGTRYQFRHALVQDWIAQRPDRQ